MNRELLLLLLLLLTKLKVNFFAQNRFEFWVAAHVGGQ